MFLNLVIRKIYKFTQLLFFDFAQLAKSWCLYLYGTTPTHLELGCETYKE